MKHTFTVETGKADQEGNAVTFETLVPKKVALTNGFDFENPIGEADIFLEEGVIKATTEIPDDFLDGYPAIGFKIKEGDTIPNDDGGVTYKNVEILSIGVVVGPNVDPAIKTFREQIASL